MKKAENIVEQRVKRFVVCNSKIREATLESEQAFLKEAGNISAAQLQIILGVGEHEPIKMSELAKRLHFTQANITQMVTRLAYKKFLKRTQSKDDKRVYYISLLTKGKRVFELNKQHIERTAREWFSHMTDEEQEFMLTMWERFI